MRLWHVETLLRNNVALERVFMGIRHLRIALFVAILQWIEKLLRNCLSGHCLLHFFFKLTSKVTRSISQNKTLLPRWEIGIGTKPPTLEWRNAAINHGPRRCDHWLTLCVILYVDQVFLCGYTRPRNLLHLPKVPRTPIPHSPIHTLLYPRLRKELPQRTHHRLLHMRRMHRRHFDRLIFYMRSVIIRGFYFCCFRVDWLCGDLFFGNAFYFHPCLFMWL